MGLYLPLSHTQYVMMIGSGDDDVRSTWSGLLLVPEY